MTRRSWPVAAGVVVLLVLHAALVCPAHGFLLSDTTGYLADARWLVGKAGSTWQGPSPFYNPGWSLLVAPLYLVLDSPRHVQLGALTVNALLATAIFPAAFVLARRTFDLPQRIALAAAAVAATYPAVVLLAGYEWGEALYQLLFIGFVLAAATVLDRPNARWAVAVGLLAAGLNATHPRGLGVIAVAGAYLIFLAARRRLPVRPAAIGIGALVLGFLATRAVSHLLLDAIYSRESAAVEGDVLARLTDPHLVWGAVKATIGQLWYLSVATFGLAPLGALWLATSRRIPKTVGVLTLAAIGATLAASAVEMSDGTRVDHMVYGRYMEGVVPVLLVAGAAAIAAWRTMLPRLLLGVAGGVTLLAGVLVAVRGGQLFTGDVMPLNVTGILLYRHRIEQVDVARVTILALVLTLAVLAVARWRAVAGLAALALVFAGSATAVQARTLQPFDDYWSSVTRIPDVVRLVSDDGAVSYDRGSYQLEPADFYQLELSDRGVRFTDGRPSTDLVIASPTWAKYGARLVFVETGQYPDQALWVLPGRLQDRLARTGYLLPEEFSAPLPPAARIQGIDTTAPPSLHPEEHRTIDVDVTHVGRGAAWAPVGVLPSVVDGTVRLGARWFDGTHTDPVLTQTAELDRVLLPRQSTDLRLELVAPAKRGRYHVLIGLRQEGKIWFERPRDFIVDVR